MGGACAGSKLGTRRLLAEWNGYVLRATAYGTDWRKRASLISRLPRLFDRASVPSIGDLKRGLSEPRSWPRPLGLGEDARSLAAGRNLAERNVAIDSDVAGELENPFGDDVLQDLVGAALNPSAE